jgi:hypothetical protein
MKEVLSPNCKYSNSLIEYVHEIANGEPPKFTDRIYSQGGGRREQEVHREGEDEDLDRGREGDAKSRAES